MAARQYGFALMSGSSQFSWLTKHQNVDGAIPSLPSHYKTFIATTDDSAPVPRIGTLTLVGPPLGFLPLHRDDRFPASIHEPELDSRLLNAGRRAGSRQVTPTLIPEQPPSPVLTSSILFRHFIGRFAFARLSSSHLTRSRRAFSLTLTTLALDQRRSRRFAARACTPAARGQTLISCTACAGTQ